MPWESTHEERLMMGCEAHPDISRFVSQAHMLEILRPGRNLVYYPDLRVDYSDGTVEIVELKSKDDKRESEPDYAAKIESAERVYEELLGWRFTILRGEEILSDPAYANLKLVQRNRRTLVSIRHEASVAELSQRSDPFPYGRACEALGGYPKGKAILHAMMVRGNVSIELYRGTINVDTPVTYRFARRRAGPPGGTLRPLPGRWRVGTPWR